MNSIVETKAFYLTCCTSTKWVDRMLADQPFETKEVAMTAAEDNWQNLDEADYLEAFAGHPKIGDMNSLKEKYRNTSSLASNEQSGVDMASDITLAELSKLNAEYEQQFGFIFIVCATGKSADEMLTILKSRIDNPREQELNIAAHQQLKIMKIRLEKAL